MVLAVRSGLAVSLALAIVASGCGADAKDESPIGVDHPIADEVSRLQEAREQGDIAAICNRLTRFAQRQAGKMGHGRPTSCDQDVRRAVAMIDSGGGWDDDRDPVVERLRHGRTAAAVATIAAGAWRAEVPFEHVDGRWRLASFFGSGATLEPAARTARAAPFPGGRGRALAAVDEAGRPCGEVATRRFPRLSGGCVLEFSNPRVAIDVLTPLGAFRFSDCAVGFRLSVGSDGRSWIDQWAVETPSPREENGCSDVNQCVVAGTYVYQPWKGRLTRNPDGSYRLVADMCLNTCVGLFTGKYVWRLVRNTDGWRAEPSDAGASGFVIDGELAVTGDLLAKQ